MKNTKKGFALPIAIWFMAFIVSFSLLLVSLIVGFNIYAKYQTTALSKQVITNQMRIDFIDNVNSGSLSGIYDFDYEIVENQDNINQKALVVKRRNSSNIDLYYLFVYDFEQSKVLANQTQNFAITVKQIAEKSYYYIADIIRYKEI